MKKTIRPSSKSGGKLTFDAVRTKQTSRLCENASVQLATHLFNQAAATEAIEALASNYEAARLHREVVDRSRGAIAKLVADSQTEAKGHRLADQVAGYLRERASSDPGDGGGLSDEEAKLAAKEIAYLIVEVQRASQRDAKVQAEFEEIKRRIRKRR